MSSMKMKNTTTRETRRTFLSRSALAASGLAVSSFDRLAWGGQAPPRRLEVSVHQYSVKPLFDSGKLTAMTYPQFAKETLGVTNVEFAAELSEPLIEDLAAAEALRRQSEAAGIKHRVFLCAAGKALDAADQEERDEALQEHLRWAKAAVALGCEFMRVRVSSEGDPEPQMKHAAAGIGAVCDALETAPVSVLVENIAGLSRNPDWLVGLAQRIGAKRVALLADFGNFDGDFYEGMKKLMPHTKSVCAKAWDFDAQGNETKIDYARMMRIVKASGYQGCVAIEYLGTRLSSVDGVRKSAALIRRYA